METCFIYDLFYIWLTSPATDLKASSHNPVFEPIIAVKEVSDEDQHFGEVKQYQKINLTLKLWLSSRNFFRGEQNLLLLQISFAMLIFLLFSDQSFFWGGQKFPVGAPPCSPEEESQKL